MTADNVVHLETLVEDLGRHGRPFVAYMRKTVHLRTVPEEGDLVRLLPDADIYVRVEKRFLTVEPSEYWTVSLECVAMGWERGIELSGGVPYVGRDLVEVLLAQEWINRYEEKTL